MNHCKSLFKKSLAVLIFFTSVPVIGQTVYTGEQQVQFMEQAFAFYQEDKYTEAEDNFSKITFNDTNYTDAQYYLAKCYNYEKNYTSAAKVINELLKYPISFDLKSQCYVLLGEIYLNDNKFEDAIKIINEGLTFYPKNESLFIVRKQAYIETKKYDLAYADLQTALLYNVNNVHVHLQNGLFAAHQGKYAEAILSLTTCLLLEPKGQRANSILVLLESIANGSFNPDNKDFNWPEDDNYFEELNLAVINKVALQSNYKAKFTIKTAYGLQLHLILANAKYDPNNSSFWNQNYLNFYKKIFEDNKLDDLVLFCLQSTENEPTLKKLASKQSRISSFIEYASTIWNNTKSYKIIKQRGENKKIFVLYESTGIQGFGSYVENKAIGNWEYYNEFGGLLAKGQFNDEGEKTGKWQWFFPHYGTLKEETNFVNGKITGYDNYYYETGGLKTTYFIKDEQLIDSIINYYQSGQISEIIPIKDGFKDGIAIEYYPNGSIKYKSTLVKNESVGLFESYHPNGKLKAQFNIKNNLIDGLRKDYYVNGQLASENNYIEGVLEGPFKEYHYNGKIESEGINKKGKWLGEVKSFYSNGNIASKVDFDENGKENGVKYFYDYDGKLFQEYHFKKGDLVAIYFSNKKGERTLISEKKDKKLMFKDFYPNGVCREEVMSVDGFYEGIAKEYDVYGNIESITKYSKGQVIDTVYVYHVNGAIKRKIPYKEGQKNGICSEYNILGQKIIEGGFSNGNQDGDWYYYNDKGVLTSHRFFVDDENQGLSNYYYYNGKLRSQEIYQNGLEIDNFYFDSLGNVRQNVKLFNGKIDVMNVNSTYVRMSGNYNNSTRDGVFKWYFTKKNLESVGKYVNDEKDSTWNYYHTNGKLKETITYLCGLINGKNTEYDANGVKSAEYYYVASKIEGESKLFENGILEADLNYFNGLREGKSIYYSNDGQIQQYRYYSKGDLISYSYLTKDGKETEKTVINRDSVRMLSYYMNGNVSYDQIRVNGLIHGYTKEFYSNGKLKQHAQFFHGLNHGYSIQYAANGQKTYENNYYLDNLDGKQIQYHANGKVKKISNYYLGEKEGFEYEYAETGTLLKTRYYFDNELIYEK